MHSDDTTEWHPYLEWDPINDSHVDGYTIYRKIDSGSWGTLTTVSSSQTDYTDYDLNTSGKQVHWAYYKVARHLSYGCNGPASSPVSIAFWNYTRESALQPSVEQESEPEGASQRDGNYPNPFNPSTTIGFQLPIAEHVVLRVFNTLGQEVAVLLDQVLPAGTHGVRFDARDLPSGIYIYHLRAGSVQKMDKMVLTR